MTSPSERYLVELGGIPGECVWCTAVTYPALCAKAAACWEVVHPYFTYYVHTAAGVAATVAVTSGEEFALWRRGVELGLHGGRSTAVRLVVRDLYDPAVAMADSAEAGSATVPRRQLLDHSLFEELGVTYTLRHSATNDLILMAAEGATSWGRAVDKAKAAWHVRGAVLRYTDEAAGERIVVSVFDAEDFAMWFRHRRPLCRELVVFDKAPYSRCPPPPGVSTEAMVRATLSAAAAGTGRAALGKPSSVEAPPGTAGIEHFDSLVAALQRRAEIAAMGRKKATDAEDATVGSEAAAVAV